MNKIDLVNKYYQAWVNKDIDSIKSILLENRFGVRNFFKAVIFNYDQLQKEFIKFELLQFDISNIEEQNNVLYCNLSFEYKYKDTVLNTSVIVKFVFKNNKIIRVYETPDNPKFTRVKCIVSYNGSIFKGMQIQPGLKTVQGDIEKGLKFLTGEDIKIHSSGRTDKGVHAMNQVFHFDTLSKIDPDKFGRVLNTYLPDSIYIKSSSRAHKTFHSRYDVKTKEYVYVINHKEYNPIQRDCEWFVPKFDKDIFNSELKKLVGTHDFTSFTKTEEDKIMVREIVDVKIDLTETHMHVSIIGKGFLRYMVRYLVGTLIDIAQGNTNLSILDYIELKNSSKVTCKAPSCGLYLKEVIYYE